MKIKGITTIALLVMLLAWPGTGFAASVGDAVPEFVLTGLDGTEYRSDSIIGEKPLMLVFWATWCPNCKKEIPDLKKIHADFKPKGLEFIAVNVGKNDSADKAKRYIKKYEIQYPAAFDNGGKITKRFKVRGIPTIIIVDKSGIVRYRSTGMPDDLEKRFDSLTE